MGNCLHINISQQMSSLCNINTVEIQNKNLNDDNTKAKSNLEKISLVKATYDVAEYSLTNMFLEGKVVNVYDGDTVHIVFIIDNKLVKFNCRLSGIDSPEICPKNIKDKEKRDQEIYFAVKSRNFLIKQVTGEEPGEKITKNEIKTLCGNSTKIIWVLCHEFDKYGRLLVEIFINKSDIISLNKTMIIESHAIEYNGGTKKEFIVSSNT
jgi:endonuclease YncB( thermonuclease family)